MARKPRPLNELAAGFLDRVSETISGRAKNAGNQLARASEFLDSARDNVKAGRPYAACTGFHEAARMSITARALVEGDRFRSGDGGHQAVIDYALGRGYITMGEWQILDQLRSDRNEIGYADDAIPPTRADLEKVASVTGRLCRDAATKVDNASARNAAVNKVTKPPSRRGKPIPPPPASRG